MGRGVPDDDEYRLILLHLFADVPYCLGDDDFRAITLKQLASAVATQFEFT